MVTVDVVNLQSRAQALAAWRRPSRLFESIPVFARAFVSGAGELVHGPWEPVADLGLRAGLKREDGWGRLALRRLTVIANWGPSEPAPLRARRSNERWRGVFEPLHSHGSMGGLDPLRGPRDGRPGGPGAIFTCGTGGGRPLAFLRQTNRVVENLHASQGLLTAFALFDLTTGGTAFSTFSCWRDLDAALAFAYRGSERHRDAIKRVRDGYYGAETYFARLRWVRSEGTIAGREPFLPLPLEMPV